jgi:hypothetical protein
LFGDAIRKLAQAQNDNKAKKASYSTSLR